MDSAVSCLNAKGIVSGTRRQPRTSRARSYPFFQGSKRARGVSDKWWQLLPRATSSCGARNVADPVMHPLYCLFDLLWRSSQKYVVAN